MKKIPKRIFLNLGDFTKEEVEEIGFKKFKRDYEVTWSEDQIGDNDIEFKLT